jgi:non-ribosomal peptide synthetase component E (peptide arylation enzyme)
VPGRSIRECARCLVAHGLSRRKLPERLEYAHALPPNAMGKVVKRELTARFVPREAV